MDYDQFIGQVQQRARLAKTDEAVRAIRATLETLGERLLHPQAEQLAARLPQKIGIHLTQKKYSRGFTLNEFFERVATRASVDLPDAVHYARAVIDVLSQAVSPGELAHTCTQLPDEFRPLFELSGEGKMEQAR